MFKKRFLAILLTAFLLFQAVSLPALADEEETATPEEPVASTEPLTPEETIASAEPVTPDQAGSDSGIDAMQALSGPNDLDVDGEAVLLYEMNSGTMVYAKNIDGRREPASLTKVMTCLLALEHGVLTDQVTASAEALADQDPNGSKSGLMVGEVFTLEQLLYCLMIQSANDAAPIIAEHIAGSESAFLDMMNKKAQELGCTGTHFANTHGLHNEDHYTTARDMAKIMLAALEYDKFREIYSTTRYELPPTNLCEESRIMYTTNYLIGTAYTSDYYDSRVIGGKTGFTTPAGRCIMCTAEEGNLMYLCVVMGASTIETEEYTTYGSFVTASKIFDHGFDNFDFAEVLSPLAPVAQLPVKDATESVVLTPSEAVTTILPENYDETLLVTTYTLSSSEGLAAPLKAGEVVGTVSIYYDSICVGQTDLVTVTSAEKRAFAAAAAQTAEDIAESPWRFVIIVVSVLLGILVLLYLWSTWIRWRNRRRRRRRQHRIQR